MQESQTKVPEGRLPIHYARIVWFALLLMFARNEWALVLSTLFSWVDHEKCMLVEVYLSEDTVHELHGVWWLSISQSCGC
jgi:hypothetical protein